MIRFCDNEVYSIAENALQREELLHFFLNGHMDEIVCIHNEAGKFVGFVTYYSLLAGDFNVAINKQAVIMDEDIFTNSRNFFKRISTEIKGMPLLPVLNKEKFLLCFAWEDHRANRELRMLEELRDDKNALGFHDIFPQYDYVTIHDCNELAYYFAVYLKKQGIKINVTGEFWDDLGISDRETGLDYREFAVNAEGTGAKEKYVGLRNSASEDFECIDYIYEENIRRGIIKDAEGAFDDLIIKLKDRHVVILGAKEEALYAYDLLLESGIDISCFASDNPKFAGGELFGKKVCKIREAMKNFENAVFINPESEYSAWGFGAVDFYSYLGYKRNESFFLLKDYTEIRKNGLLNVLERLVQKCDGRLILTGDRHLCKKLRETIRLTKDKMYDRVLYMDIFKEYEDGDSICISEIGPEDICLTVIPAWVGQKNYLQEMRDELDERLRDFGIKKILAYPSDPEFFIRAEEAVNESEFKVGKILIGANNHHSGNAFFREVLDGHPDILTIDFDYNADPNVVRREKNFLNDNLFFLCMKLAMEKANKILPLFWELYEKMSNSEDGPDCVFFQKQIFNGSMEEMLNKKERFTSQELFVIFHIAFAKMSGQKINDLSTMTIYWEPHEVRRNVCEEYTYWLKSICDSGYIITMVRNACTTALSWIEHYEKEIWGFGSSFGGRMKFASILSCPNGYLKEYEGWERILIRFEDLKSNPQKKLAEICEKTGISWSDVLLIETKHGQPCVQKGHAVNGYNMASVYRSNESYISEFDRFRISIILGIWQKEYGYPYVSSLQFTRRELFDMFRKEFGFESRLKFNSSIEKRKFKKWICDTIVADNLQINRRKERLQTSETNFSPALRFDCI